MVSSVCNSAVFRMACISVIYRSLSVTGKSSLVSCST